VTDGIPRQTTEEGENAVPEYRTEFVLVDHITPRLGEQWRDLADRAAEPNPPCRPIWSYWPWRICGEEAGSAFSLSQRGIGSTPAGA
jgi:hypothetical protein